MGNLYLPLVPEAEFLAMRGSDPAAPRPQPANHVPPPRCEHTVDMFGEPGECPWLDVAIGEGRL